LKRLLAIMEKDMSRQEIQAALALRGRENFEARYLKPALAAALIERTIPDKPNSRLQKYRLTRQRPRPVWPILNPERTRHESKIPNQFRISHSPFSNFTNESTFKIGHPTPKLRAREMKKIPAIHHSCPRNGDRYPRPTCWRLHFPHRHGPKFRRRRRLDRAVAQKQGHDSFLGVWERINNPHFNSPEFEGIRNEAGRNSFYLSAKKWIELTGAKGLIASAGRYGGTFAHRDIAFEFGSWLSPEFKLYLITEFQRLKDDENDRLKLGWNLQRTLAKINYRIHTDAIKETLLPPLLSKAQTAIVYANEADLLNVALFGQTASNGATRTLRSRETSATMPRLSNSSS
jgi:hypothetical protein